MTHTARFPKKLFNRLGSFFRDNLMISHLFPSNMVLKRDFPKAVPIESVAAVTRTRKPTVWSSSALAATSVIPMPYLWGFSRGWGSRLPGSSLHFFVKFPRFIAFYLYSPFYTLRSICFLIIDLNWNYLFPWVFPIEHPLPEYFPLEAPVLRMDWTPVSGCEEMVPCPP